MKIAISSNNGKGLDSTVSEHFGRCPFFTVVTYENNQITKTEIVENPLFQGHQPFEIPNFLKSLGIDAILTQGMGGRAIDFFQQNSIEPVTGCMGTIKEAVTNYLAGNRSKAAPCQESIEHQHGGNAA
jgi:predicted Fe-Mo cluster-binding NifX family protein